MNPWLIGGVGALALIALTGKSKAKATAISDASLSWERFLELNTPTGVFIYDGKEYPDYSLASLTLGYGSLDFGPAPKLTQVLFADGISMSEAKKALKSWGDYDVTKRQVLAIIKEEIPNPYRGVAAAIVWHETNRTWDPLSAGPSKDYGLYQITIPTATYKWPGEAAEEIRECLPLLYDPVTSSELAAVMLKIWDEKYGFGRIDGILRRWGGGTQLLEPESDRRAMLLRAAYYSDVLR